MSRNGSRRDRVPSWTKPVRSGQPGVSFPAIIYLKMSVANYTPGILFFIELAIMIINEFKKSSIDFRTSI